MGFTGDNQLEELCYEAVGVVFPGKSECECKICRGQISECRICRSLSAEVSFSYFMVENVLREEVLTVSWKKVKNEIKY